MGKYITFGECVAAIRRKSCTFVSENPKEQNISFISGKKTEFIPLRE